MAPVDRLLATILFTDIVGSTERAAQLGDREWRALLARHYDITRAEVERYRGKVWETTGDGVKATFDGPARAIRAARSVSDRIASIGLQIRAGLHTGEVELRDGAFGGIAVHIAARVMALAGPGEVLVSSTVKDLVIGSGTRFSDRGVHTLKGVPDDWHLFLVER
jgi:class 3 adenylate cyclase